MVNRTQNLVYDFFHRWNDQNSIQPQMTHQQSWYTSQRFKTSELARTPSSVFIDTYITFIYRYWINFGYFCHIKFIYLYWINFSYFLHVFMSCGLWIYHSVYCPRTVWTFSKFLSSGTPLLWLICPNWQEFKATLPPCDTAAFYWHIWQ
jgi:hypothetical protein